MHFEQMKGVGKPAEILLLPVLNTQQKFSFTTSCNMESVIDEAMRTDLLPHGECLINLLPCS